MNSGPNRLDRSVTQRYGCSVVALLIFFACSPAIAAGTAPYIVNHWVVGRDGRIDSKIAKPGGPYRMVAGTVVPTAFADGSTTNGAGRTVGPPLLQPAWNSRSWTTEDGLPDNHVRTLCQTSDGYLWVGTVNGLTRFDGRRFITFDKQNNPVLSAIGDDVRSLVEGTDGRLWVATRNGIGFVKDRRWELVCVPEKGQRLGIRDIATETSGRTWVATDGGLRQLRDGRLTTDGFPGVLNSALTLSVRVAGSNELWVANSGGVYSWPLHGNEVVTRVEPLPPDSLVNALSVGRNGDIFARSHLTLRIWNGNRLRSLKLPGAEDAAVSTHVNHVTPGFEDDAWVSLGERMQLFHARSNRLDPVVLRDGSLVEDVSAIALDREGNVWCGTTKYGLLRIRRDRMLSFQVQEPPLFQNVKAVMEGPNGGIWFGTTGGVVGWSGEKIDVYEFVISPNISGSTPAVFSLCKASDGSVWSGFHSDGAIRLNPGDQPLLPRFLTPTGEDRRLGQVRAMIQSADGSMWLGTSDGLWVVPKVGVGTRDPAKLYLEHRDVRVILEEPDGTIWAGTAGAGLWSITRPAHPASVPTVRQFSVADGLAADQVWALHRTSDGELWVGTERGLSRLNDGRFISIHRQDGLEGDQVYSILEDRRGRFWISSRKGIYRLDRKALAICANGGECILEPVFYGVSDGMVAAEVNGESQQSACEASDGRFYFATRRGVVAIDPNEVDDSLPVLPILIEQVQAGGGVVFGDGFEEKSLPLETMGSGPKHRPNPPEVAVKSGAVPVIELNARNAQTVAISYTANSFADPNRIRFQHRLLGFSETWQLGSSDRITHYTNLKPGRYRFQIRAKNHFGTWSGTGSEIAIVLRPAYWQTTAFKLTVCLVVIIVVTLTIRWRMNWQRQVLLLERRMELNNERNRIARDMHDELGARLSELALQSGGTPAHPKADSATIVLGVRETLAHLNEIIWAVDPGNDSIQSLADFFTSYGQRYLARAGIRIELNLDNDSGSTQTVPPGIRRHLASMYREILRNVVQHSHAKKVRVSMACKPGILAVKVVDDGSGFDSSGTTQGRGLEHLTQRAVELGGATVIQTSLGKGTSICIEIPFKTPQ